MQFVQMLASVHLSLAMGENPPWFHEVKIGDPPEEKERKEIIEKAYEEYKTLKLPIGTVDVAYSTLADIFFKHLQSGKIPNGCCSKTDCYTNKFYDILRAQI